MAWQQELVIMTRFLINDIDPANQQYTDDRLESLLAISAQLIQSEIDFNTKYVVDIDNAQITPDPTTPNKDNSFIQFMVLKAACLVDQGTYRQKALLEGVRANAGPASLSISGGAAAFLPILKDIGPCKAYQELKYNGTQADFVRSVLSPFNSDDFDPQYGLYYGSNNTQVDACRVWRD